MFKTPAMLDEIVRKPIEQFRMRWPLALVPKVVRRADQTVAEVPRPNTINNDARRERIFRCGQPLC